MKNKIFALLLVLGTIGAVNLPAPAADNKPSNLLEKVEAAANGQVRYVRVRGKRYKVWYRTSYRNGRRYVRVTRIRRA